MAKPPHHQPITSLRWLAAAIAATLVVALCFVYLTFCLLFWQGQWQLTFQPSPTITATPQSAGLAFQDIQFDATETGVLQLHGWWLPASRPTTATMLLLHDGTGSLSNTVPQLRALHALGLNLFVFDYRGFGQSAHRHPSEESTREDAEASWRYLTDTRHIPPQSIVLDGSGLGAAIAVDTATRHPQAPAVILEHPRPPVLDTLRASPRMRLLPVRLLFHDRFDPGPGLAELKTPKLFLYPAEGKDHRYYDQAANPKTAADTDHEDPGYTAAIKAFLKTCNLLP